MLSIFKAQQIEIIRDKSSIFFTVLFPTLLVFILGTMLASLDNPDMEIEPMTIGYTVNADDPGLGATVDAIVAQFKDVEQVDLVAVESAAAVDEQLIKGEMSAFVVFSQPFAMEIHDGSNDIQNRAVHSIFESIARIHGATSAVMSESSAGGLNASYAGATNQTVNPETSAPSMSEQATLLSNSQTSRVEEKVFGISRSMIDYYAITMIVMMFFMGSLQASAGNLYGNRKDGNLSRTLASSASRLSIYMQYVLSNVPYNFVQVGIVMLASTTLWGAHYATTWEANLLLFAMLFCTGLAASALSLLLGILVRFNPTALLMIIAWPMLFLSGTFSKEIFIPGFSDFLPPTIIQQAAFDLTLFGQSGRSITVLVVSLAIILVATVVGALLFNRKSVAA